MLSTFLSQLQSYFSKYFIVGSFFPMLAFTFLNGLIAYFLIGSWHHWVDDNILKATASGAAFFTASIVVAVLLAAYVLAALSTFLRRMLEGQWSEPLRARFVPSQNRRREAIATQLSAEGREMADLRYAPAWVEKIAAAWAEGRGNHPNDKRSAPRPDPIALALESLERQRDKYGRVPAETLEAVAVQIADELKTCNGDISLEFNGYNGRLNALLQYAGDRVRARYARLQNELNSNFGLQELAPTKMGNVANTVQGYAIRRYHCNFEIAWSNLQRIVAKDDKASATLQEAKTQLDFLVACCWLSLVSAAAWSIIFAFFHPNGGGFLLAALGGPVIAYMWYRAAAEQYRSFADVVMMSLDTFRFDLLRQMRMKLPVDVEDEREMWEHLDKLTTFGELQNFQYEHPKQ
jgi:hypothetical protein